MSSLSYRLLTLSCLAISAPLLSAEPDKGTAIVRPGETLVLESTPEIPKALADRVRRYTEARAAGVLDWHPTDRTMLISTRFANSNQVHRVSQPGGARYQLTFFDEPVANASYEPKNGSYMLLSKDTGGNEFSQIYRQDLATGELTLLTDGGRTQNGGWRWNHQKNAICYASTKRNGADRDLWIMNPIDSSTNRMVMENSGGGWAVLDWSEDDSKLLVRESISVNKSNLYLVEVATGKRSMITKADTDAAYGQAQFAPGGESVYVTTDLLGEFQQLGILSLKDQSVSLLTKDIPWDVESFELSHDGSKISFNVNQRGASQLYVMDTKTKQMRKVGNLPVGTVALGDWRQDDSEFAITVSSAKSVSDAYSVDAKTLGLTRWTESEMGGLSPNELSEAELIEWKSFDNLPISGFLYRPNKKFQGKRPVIISIHGGPEGQSRPSFQGRNNYFLNELGCAIIAPNVRGSTGFGKSFVKLDNGTLRLNSVKDIGALLDWIAKAPDLDADRVMITGGSYGGYMTLACAVEYNDRIACSLDVVGISHFKTFLENTESYRRDLRRVEYGDERDPEMAKFFDQMAPLNQSDRIRKPLMVVQGGNDPRVPLSEAEQIVKKVKGNQTPVWYMMARDEGHGFKKKNNVDYQFYTTILFVENNLLGKEDKAGETEK